MMHINMTTGFAFIINVVFWTWRSNLRKYGKDFEVVRVLDSSVRGSWVQPYPGGPSFPQPGHRIEAQESKDQKQCRSYGKMVCLFQVLWAMICPLIIAHHQLWLYSKGNMMFFSAMNCGLAIVTCMVLKSMFDDVKDCEEANKKGEPYPPPPPPIMPV